MVVKATARPPKPPPMVKTKCKRLSQGFMPSNEVERQADALPTNEDDLSTESIPSDNQITPSPRRPLEPIVRLHRDVT